MTQIKFTDGTVINAASVELVRGVLKITTTDRTVEELAGLFSDKSNTSRIVLLTESGAETGYREGFTSFAGINYGADGSKTVELYQPADVTEARISKAEGAASTASTAAASANAKASEVAEQNATFSATLDSILTELIPSLLA